MNEMYYLLVIVLNYVVTISADEVLGCGGFIKSHVPIDFSKVEVKLVTKQGIVKDTTTAAPNNGYYFVPLYDKGELLLELSPPPGWSFEPKQVALSVDGMSDLCSQGKDINFIFQGFGITGKVESLGSDNGGPERVTVQLEFNGDIRTTLTDKDGNFFFTPVFPGNYTVSITHTKYSITFVQVAESNTELPKSSLVIQGYEVKGLVISEGDPVKDATIIAFSKNENKNVLVDGCSKESLEGVQFKNKILCHVASNEAGIFKFGTLPNGQYYVVPHYKGQNIYFQPERIEFTVNHNNLELQDSFEIIGFSIPDDLIFEEIIVRINPSLQELPDILPSAFKVCGEVTSDHSQIVTFSKVGSTKYVQTETFQDGSFCQYLSPGKYEVQVVVSNEDKQKGLQFFPITQTIEVTSEKVLDIIFSQLKSNIYGKVQCIRPNDCEGLTVLLRNGNEKEVSLKVKDNMYSVSDMYPGSYEILLIAYKFCWKISKQVINVNTANVYFKLAGQTSTTRFDISKGRSSYCLEQPGEYLFNLEGCHSYNPKTISYNTDSEINEVLLTAVKHTLKLVVQAEVDFGNIQVSVKIGTDKTEKILKYTSGQYELDILLEPDESAVVIPQSDTIFFSPPILSVQGRDDCVNLGIKFVAVKGKVFKGNVIPPLAEVTITVESTDAETLVVETDAKGNFKFPPLDNKKDYKISAQKNSYVLSGPDKDGNFLAHKLAEVIVEVLDGADNIPLSGVLLSLSGGESYRRNLQSDENGKISFHSLSPSEYFLRPMMKDGKRVAYSAFGQVVSLNDEPEDNMIIVAFGFGNCSHYSEETTCETNGRFRIRGLQPYCSYKVVVKGSVDDKHIVERTAPEFIEINNINRDINNLKLIVFRPATQMDVLVKVYADNIEHYKSLKVKLTREAGSSVVVHTAKVDISAMKLTKDINPGVLLHIPPLPIDERSYSIQLESNLVQNIKWKPQIVHFNANTSFKFIELDFNVKSSISEQPIKQTSIWSLVFIFSILFAIYNIELIANVLRDKFNFNISALTNWIPVPSTNQKNTNDYYDNAQIDQIVQSINNVKRKPKPKKA
ncbi:hypothetical protein NQ314_009109 [Rhamnusium bicolor]|uniref:Nodal modulator 1 n=1 Tax=Rhamnusium bicolor TaxID=1586634 RepID=A0AAV8Y3B3_9CUCU|nr:hypothetical protein NQ314_009109 [Rhamnusium bicolor]